MNVHMCADQPERSRLVPNKISHVEIIGTDAPGLQKFYAELFDWNVNADNPFNYGLIDASEAGVPGGIGGDMGGGARVTLYVGVDDLQAYLDKAEKLGGKTVMPPTEIMEGVTLALFTDPDGNVTGLTKA